MSETSAVVEKSLRSVFVGNIPYEATEERLKEIFNHVGPVASFKLMHDRESGKPKGYGFCEYKDQETALSAMRNLNGYEIGGRPLRVDNACTEKSRMEMQSLMIGSVVESPYGNEVEASQAPEAISNAVASLPPEQMFELMRQMQVCVRSNRSEARTMLLDNPQLAYALLQAQVVMRIIDPKTAVQLLHGEANAPLKQNTPSAPAAASSNSNGSAPSNGIPSGPPPPQRNNPPSVPPPHHRGPPPKTHFPPPGGRDFDMYGPPPHGPPPHGVPPPGPPDGPHGPPSQRGSDQDMRMPPGGPPPAMGGMDFRGGDFDGPSRFNRNQGPPDFDGRENHFRGPPRGDRDHRGRGGEDHDYRGPRDDFSRGPPPGPVGPPAGGSSGAPVGLPPNFPAGIAGQDKEKASLIMQVLQLSDEQIRMLPPEQQASILQLKDQIQKSQA